MISGFVGRGSLLWVKDEQALDQASGIERKLICKGVLQVQNLLEGQVIIGGFERRAACEQLEDDTPKSPEVGGKTRSLVFQQLGADVLCCSHEGVRTVLYIG